MYLYIIIYNRFYFSLEILFFSLYLFACKQKNEFAPYQQNFILLLRVIRICVYTMYALNI